MAGKGAELSSRAWVRKDKSRGGRQSDAVTGLRKRVTLFGVMALTSLLDIPPELISSILLYLSPHDILACRTTCRTLCDLCGESHWRYLVQMERSAVSDDMSPGLCYPDRLRILEKREEAWETLDFRKSVQVDMPFEST